VNRYVADTMALVLRLERRKMPISAKEKFEEAENGQAEILIPAMVFSELGYLAENNRIDTDLQEAQKYLDNHQHIKEQPLTLEHVKTAFEIDDIPELHDRLIAAVGKQLDAEIITNDPEIQSSVMVKTIWK